MKYGCRGIVAVLIMAFCVSCVQAKPKADQNEAAKLMISRGANGVNMQWMAEEGVVYTLYYRDTVGSDTAWRPVPGYKKVLGKGELVTFSDAAPTAKTRRYRVHTVMPFPGSGS